MRAGGTAQAAVQSYLGDEVASITGLGLPGLADLSGGQSHEGQQDCGGEGDASHIACCSVPGEVQGEGHVRFTRRLLCRVSRVAVIYCAANASLLSIVNRGSCNRFQAGVLNRYQYRHLACIYP